VSQQLKLLESSLGVLLFRKGGRELTLTDAALELAQRVAHSFDSLEDALAQARRPNSGSRLRVVAMPSFAVYWLLPRLANFYATHTNIDIEVSISSVVSVSLQLDQGDLIVRHGTGQWSDAAFDHVFDDALTPVCSPELASSIQKPSDVLNFNLLHSIMRPSGWGIWLKAAGLEEKTNIPGRTLGNASMCYQGAIDGLGIAIAQLDYVREDLRRGRLVQPLDIVARTDAGYYLVCDRIKAEQPTIAAFRSWVRSVR
jgi:DNA-binding transcriptional LysR family regulator